MTKTAAVRYFTRSGNTKKVAEEIAGAAGCRAEQMPVPLDEKVDILFIGASVYWGGISSEVKDYIKTLDKDKIGKAVIFSTSALAERAFPQIKNELQGPGVREQDNRKYLH